MSAAALRHSSLDEGGIQAILGGSMDHARRIGALVNIAIVDAGGNLSGFLRMPGAFLASIELAQDKAWTACSFGLGTRALGEMLERESMAVRDGLLRRPRLSAIPGGLPIERGGELLGGIGVSGGSAEQDEEIAISGLHALAEV